MADSDKPSGETVQGRKPHRVTARIDRWGEVRLAIECPYTLADRAVRRCNLGNEPDKPCLWKLYENGDHHPDCPAFRLRDAECIAAGQDGTCWPEVPEECDGFESSELGHLHPVEGCWAQEMIGEVGWDDCVSWKGNAPPTDVPLPVEVDVSSDDEGIYLTLWSDVLGGYGEQE